MTPKASSWTAPYIGVPFKLKGDTPEGWDCYGLVRYIYSTHLAIELPKFDYETVKDLSHIVGLFDSGIAKWKQVETPRPFDAILLRLAGLVTHCGVYTESGRMLHVLRGCETSLIRLESHLWKPVGFYQWVG